MKGKISSIGRVVIALALVLSLSLVMAAPVAADSPASTDVGFEFGIAGGGSDTVKWDAVPATGLPVGGLGNYSVWLHKDGSTGPTTYVEFTPVPGTTLSDLEALTNDWSFWYHLVGTPSPAGPQLELKFTSGTDFVDITVMAAQASYATENAWEEVVLADDLIKVGYWGSVIAWGEGPTLAEAIEDVLADPDFDVPGDWELTRVRAELYETAPTRDCHIDDITIDGTLYELEPIFLDALYYSVGDTVEVTVPNFAANTDSIRINPVAANYTTGVLNDNWTVTATSDSDPGAAITVALEETGANTGVFTGSFATTNTVPVAEDEVYVEDGAVITVTYTPSDPWWGAGSTAVAPTITAEVDDTAPTIVIVSPDDGEQIDDPMPVISATYSDTPTVSGIDQTSVEMLVDDVDVTDDDATTVTDAGVTYTPTEDLADGSHDVTVNVSDNAGNAATEVSWSFSIVSWFVDPVSGAGPDLDALDTVGVAVSDATGATDITVGRYASNPEPGAPPTFSLIENGFFDVKVTGGTATQIVIKFADPEITAETTACFWDDVEGAWLECSDQGYNSVDEFLWVKVRTDTTPNIAELGGTPFAIGAEEAPPEFDPMVYDEDEDGVIEIGEVLNAISDYFATDITITEVLEVIALYF